MKSLMRLQSVVLPEHHIKHVQKRFVVPELELAHAARVQPDQVVGYHRVRVPLRHVAPQTLPVQLVVEAEVLVQPVLLAGKDAHFRAELDRQLEVMAERGVQAQVQPPLEDYAEGPQKDFVVTGVGLARDEGVWLFLLVDEYAQPGEKVHPCLGAVALAVQFSHEPVDMVFFGGEADELEQLLVTDCAPADIGLDMLPLEGQHHGAHVVKGQMLVLGALDQPAELEQAFMVVCHQQPVDFAQPVELLVVDDADLPDDEHPGLLHPPVELGLGHADAAQGIVHPPLQVLEFFHVGIIRLHAGHALAAKDESVRPHILWHAEERAASGRAARVEIPAPFETCCPGGCPEPKVVQLLHVERLDALGFVGWGGSAAVVGVGLRLLIGLGWTKLTREGVAYRADPEPRIALVLLHPTGLEKV